MMRVKRSKIRKIALGVLVKERGNRLERPFPMEVPKMKTKSTSGQKICQ